MNKKVYPIAARIDVDGYTGFEPAQSDWRAEMLTSYTNIRSGDACGNRTRVSGETVRYPDRWTKAPCSILGLPAGFEPAFQIENLIS